MKRYEDSKATVRPRLVYGAFIFGMVLMGCAASSSKGTTLPQEALNDDSRIVDAVEQEILYDRSVSLNDIEVTVSDGIVSLTGSTPTLLSADRAARIAKTVKGVRGVVNQIEVSPLWERADWEIEQNAQSALKYDPAVDDLDLDVSVENKKATITGNVKSWRQRDLVETIVKGVKGVKKIENEVHFDEASYERSDEEIAEEIRATLRSDVLVDDALIDVRVDEGRVSLVGTVGSAAEKSRAFFDAWLGGVGTVDDSELEVKFWARDENLRKGKYVHKSDDAVEKAVRSVIKRDPRVFEFTIDTDVSDGAVTLRGTVDNLEAKRSAKQDALNTVGVLSVRNMIRVQTPTPTDKDIAERIRKFYAWDPYVDRYEIGVSVSNGTAQLVGEVNSFFEKARADDLAASTRGVVRVQNDLRINHDKEPFFFNPHVQLRDPQLYEWFRYHPTTTQKSDAQIAIQINRELRWCPFVDASDISIVVDDGVAILEGEVESKQERREAAEEAFEGGAAWVKNRLEIN